MTGSVAIGGGRGNGLRPWVWSAAACLLALPALAMKFIPDSGVDWSAMDFVVMGAMLTVACGLYELGAWRSGNIAYRMGFALAVLAGFLTVWANLAVGMLGSENDMVNLMFAGVLFVAAIGALLSVLRPAGMALTMAATAVAQLLAAAIGLAMREFEALELLLTALFALPWVASAALFRKAAQDAVAAGA